MTLKISSTGGSGDISVIGMECPRSVHLRRSGWRRRRMPHYFWHGALVHLWGLAPYRKMKNLTVIDMPTQGREHAEDVLAHGIFTEPQEDGTEISSPAETSFELTETIPVETESMLTVWDEQRPLTVVACEQKLSTAPFNPLTGSLDGEAQDLDFIITGRVDLVLLDLETDRLKIRDLKTSQAKLSQNHMLEWGYLLQLGGYSYLWAACKGQDTPDLACLVLTKQKTVEAVRNNFGEYRFPTMPIEKIYQITYDRFFSAAKNFRACERMERQVGPEKAWPQNPNRCIGRFGQLCEYHPLCFPWAHPKPEKVIEETLINERNVA